MLKRLAVIAFLLVACKDAKPGDEIIGELADLTNAMCACKDAACAQAVAAQHAALQERARTIYRSMKTFPKENVNRIVLLDKQLKRCREAIGN